jgi:hypothetical protein
MHFVMENVFDDAREKEQAVKAATKQIETYLAEHFNIYRVALQPEFIRVRFLVFVQVSFNLFD